MGVFLAIFGIYYQNIAFLGMFQLRKTFKTCFIILQYGYILLMVITTICSSKAFQQLLYFRNC